MKTSKPSDGWAPESTTAFWVNRASRALLRAFEGKLRPFGFAMSQLPVLRALGGGKSLPQKDLVLLARVEQPTMAEMLVRMERDGVIERKPNPEDKRGTLVSLTRASRTRIPKAMAALMEAERSATLGLSDSEKKQLRELLERVVKNLESQSSLALS